MLRAHVARCSERRTQTPNYIAFREIWLSQSRLAQASRNSEQDVRAVISRENERLNAFVSVSSSPLEESFGAQKGQDGTAGALVGLPVALKDNICATGMPTTCSSRMLREFRPQYDATVTRLLRKAGADIVGKTNCDEFGMGSLTTNSVHGSTVNPLHPHSPPRSAGGSSGGSAAAVAADMCYAALGTDTGGSVRLPAAYTGVVGFKPSYGLVSRYGVVPYADSLDCVGVLAQDVGGVKKVFDVINQYDPMDPTGAPLDVRTRAGEVVERQMQHWSKGSERLKGLRIGVPTEFFPAELSPRLLPPLHRALSLLQHRGAVVKSVSLRSPESRGQGGIEAALAAYYVLATAEASSNLARFDGVRYGHQSSALSHKRSTVGVDWKEAYSHARSEGFGQEVQKRILLGAYALSADKFDNYFLQAQRIRTRVRAEFDRALRAPNVLSSRLRSEATHGNADGVDVLIHLSAIRTAPPLDDPPTSLDAYVQDVLTVPASLAGLPAISVPAGSVRDGRSHSGGSWGSEEVGVVDGEGEGDAWPVGVSVTGQWGCDETVLAVGQALERAISEG